jgi:hypothetical protein
MDVEIKNLLDKLIVVDTNSRWLYVGTLKKIGKAFLTLQDVDAHDVTETTSTRDEYLAHIKSHGLVVNRNLVTISKEKLIGLTLLEDVNL